MARTVEEAVTRQIHPIARTFSYSNQGEQEVTIEAFKDPNAWDEIQVSSRLDQSLNQAMMTMQDTFKK